MSKGTSKDTQCDYNNFKRARYFHGMLMTDRDFREEQIYHIEKRKLLNRMLHGWGVVCGFEINWEAGKSALTIKPGMALDCHGNEILVCDPVEINLTSLPCPAKIPARGTLEYCRQQDVEKKPNIYYIAIRYHEVPSDPVPVYAPAGGCEEKACEYSRIREGFCVEILDHQPCQPVRSVVKPSLLSRIFDTCESGGSANVIVNEGKARGVLGNTIIIASTASTVANYYKGMQIEVISDGGKSQTRTITAYDPVGKATDVTPAWDLNVAVPDGSRYIIRNSSGTSNDQECQRKEVDQFSKEFCPKPLPCPDCCPEEHFIVLGSFEMEQNQKAISQLNPNCGRSYVPSIHLFKYLFSSLTDGLDTFFKVARKDGTTAPVPDINLIHTNPIEALCWLGRVFSENSEIKSREDLAKWFEKEKEPVAKPLVDPEVIKLKKELAALKATVEKMKKG